MLFINIPTHTRNSKRKAKKKQNLFYSSILLLSTGGQISAEARHRVEVSRQRQQGVFGRAIFRAVDRLGSGGVDALDGHLYGFHVVAVTLKRDLKDQKIFFYFIIICGFRETYFVLSI